MLSVHQAIVLCLDLSESMNKRSGVSRPTGREVLEEDEFDEEKAVSNLLDELVKDVSEDVILENGETHFLTKNGVLTSRRTAKSYLRKQHPSCHQAWRFYCQGDSGSEDDSIDYDYNPPIYELLSDLEAMARRDALNLSFTLESNRGNSQTKIEMLEVCLPVSGFECHIYNIAVGTFCDCV